MSEGGESIGEPACSLNAPTVERQELWIPQARTRSAEQTAGEVCSPSIRFSFSDTIPTAQVTTPRVPRPLPILPRHMIEDRTRIAAAPEALPT